VVNAVVVWLDDPLLVSVTKPQQASVFDRGPEQWINIRLGCVGHPGAPHPLVSAFPACGPVSPRLRESGEPRCVRSGAAGRSRLCSPQHDRAWKQALDWSDAASGRPRVLPFCRAWAQPARTRSPRISRFNSANTARSPAIARPAGVVRSSAAVSDTKPTPRCCRS
jgi:hypothetical protein